MREFVTHLAAVDGIGEYNLFQDIAQKNPDLEFLLEQLRQLEEKDYIQKNPTSSVLAIQTPALGTDKGRGFFGQTARLAADLRSKIETQIFYAYRGFDNPGEVGPHFRPLFDLVANHLASSEPIVVFTTNYDSGVELFCQQIGQSYALWDGFFFDAAQGRMIWSAQAFRDWAPLQNRKVRPVVLVKLHGSTSWFRQGELIIKGPELFAPGDPMFQNLLIYPAERKVAIQEPFFTAYYLLQESLKSARSLIVVGYSFRDLDALTRLMAATRSNPQLQVAVIDPYADQIARNLRQHELDVKPFQGWYDTRLPQFSDLLSEVARWMNDRN